MIRRGLVALAVVVGLDTGLAARAAELVPAGERRAALTERNGIITLENGFLRLVVDANDGGRIVSLVHKRSGNDLTPVRTDTRAGGMLSDGVWSQDYWRGDWHDSKYLVEILDQGPATARVALTCAGRLWQDVIIRKEIALDANRSAVTVQYTLFCGPKVNPKLLPDFTFHNAIAGSGRAFMPTPQGVLALPLGAEEDSWEYEPTAGWCAFVRDDGVSVGATMAFNHLRALRSNHRGVHTLEWVWRYMRAGPELKVQSPVELGVFTGLKDVAGVSGTAAAEVAVGEEKDGKRAVTVTVAAMQEIAGELTLSIRRLPDGAVTKVGSAAVAIEPDASKAVAFDLATGGEGTFVLIAELRSGTDELLRCEKPLMVGQPSGTYAMAPAGPQRPEAGRRSWLPINFNFNSTSVETPHVKWAQPYAGGRPKVLALMPVGHGRESIELAQRFDMDLTTTYLNNELVGWSLGDAAVSTKELQAHQAEILKRDYDVIILNNSWDLLSGPARERVQEMVNNGAGLLMVGSVPVDLKDFVPMKPQRESVSSRWLVPKDSREVVGKALPFEALPPMRMINVMLQTPVDDLLDEPPAVLIAGRGTFYAAEWMRGKGRVIQINSSTLLSNQSTGVGDPPMFPWWEYNYAMVGRLLYRAAGKVSPVEMLEVQCAGRAVTVRLQSKMEGPGKASITLRDPFGELLHEAAVDVSIKKGAQEIKVDVPAAVGGQYRIADVIVSGERGTLAWGAGAVASGPARITRCTFDKIAYGPEETASLKVATSGAPAGAVVRAELWDASHRLLAESEAPASGETELQLPLVRVLGPAFDVRVRVIAGGATQDATLCHSFIKRPWEHRVLRTFFWGGPAGLGATQPHLVYDLYKRLTDVGMNANWGDKYPEGHSWANDRLNMAFELPSTGMSFKGLTKQALFAKPGADDPPASALAATKTRGARDAYLDQNPEEEEFVGDPANAPGAKGASTVSAAEQQGGIGDPAVGVDLYKRGVDKAKMWNHRNLLMYGCADENEGPGPDVNFNAPALAEFRRWLRETQYKTVEDLNREWATAFKTWDEVMPLTEAEARQHGGKTGCYGAWSDQRQFNKWSYASFAKSFADGVKSIQPEALVGDSGTQESQAYSGRDWSMLAPAYSGLSAYGGTQTPEQDMFNPTLIRYPWNGYNKPNPRNRNSNWAILSGNNHGYGYFCDNSYIDPDQTLSQDGRDLQAAQVDINNGAGQLLVDAQVVWDPVYILHSMASLHGAYIQGEAQTRAEALHVQSQSGLMSLLKDMGITFRSVSGGQVTGGYLQESGARVLFLPHMVAMSAAEAAAIRQWVEQGGTVIADLSPAVMNEHCRVLEKGQLDDLFGIDRTNAAIVPGKLSAGGKPAAWLTRPNGEAITICEAALVETGVKASGEPLWRAQRDAQDEPTPIVFRRDAGKGRAWYLGYHAFGSYGNLKSAVLKAPEAAAALTQYKGLFESMLGDAGVKPRSVIRLYDPKSGETGAPAPYVLTFNKQSGDVRYVTAMRDYYCMGWATKDFPARVCFDKPAYIHEVRTGSYLGYGQSVDLTMTEYTMRVFALLPYRVEAMSLAAASQTVKAGEDARIEAQVKSTGNCGTHWLRVEVTRPDGTAARTYGGNVKAPGGKATLVIPFALNDLRGAWKVRVRDVASGARSECSIQLEAR